MRKQQFLFNPHMLDQPIFEERTNVPGTQFGLALGQVAGAQSPRQHQRVMMPAKAESSFHAAAP